MKFTDRQKALIVRMVRIGSRTDVIALALQAKEKEILKFVAYDADCQAAMKARNVKPEPTRNRPNEDYSIETPAVEGKKDPRRYRTMYNHDCIARVIKRRNPFATQRDVAKELKATKGAKRPPRDELMGIKTAATVEDVIAFQDVDRKEFPKDLRFRSYLTAEPDIQKKTAPIILAACNGRYTVLKALMTQRAANPVIFAVKKEAVWNIKQQFPSISMQMIACLIGLRDHTGVYHILKKKEKEIKKLEQERAVA